MTKSILITGASTGIGFAAAMLFCQKGYDVFAGVRKASDQEALLAQSTHLPGKMHGLILDVTKPAQIEQARKQIESQTQSLHALINNAGIVVAGPLEAIDPERLHEQFDVNVFGSMRMTQTFLPLLRRSQGRIINISSIAGRTVTPFLAPYCASKYALEALSDALRVELDPDKIKVILIEPGSIATPIWEKSITNNFANLKSTMNPALFAIYESRLKAMDRLAQTFAKRANPVQTVLDKIVLAVESPNPHTRYLVGQDAKLAVLQNLLPDKLRDGFLLSTIKRFSDRKPTDPV